MTIKAPFPYFGGKRRVAAIVWERFGDVPNYVEPFAGSLAVLLGRPHEARAETVNDLDCYLANFWRALQADPDAVAEAADWPVNEADLHARHQWLVDRVEFRERMKVDPEYFDARIAGWWVWGISQWIGSGWCQKPEWLRTSMGKVRGVHGTTVGGRKRPMVKKGGCGVHRTRPDVSDPNGRGVHKVGRQLPCISGDSGATGRGVNASAIGQRGGSPPGSTPSPPACAACASAAATGRGYSARARPFISGSPPCFLTRPMLTPLAG